MKVDLKDVLYSKVRDIIYWCYEHDIDKSKAGELIFHWHNVEYSYNDGDWVLDIPDEVVTLFMLQWE